MRVGNIFTRIARSKAGEKFFKNLSNPEKQTSVTNMLLAVETVGSTLSYMYFTQVQKDIDKESKFAMQVQHVLSAVLSLAICTPLNKKVGKFSEQIAKKVDPKIEDPHKVAAGLCMATQMGVITLFNRMALPSCLTPVSSKVRDYLKEKHGKELDIRG